MPSLIIFGKIIAGTTITAGIAVVTGFALTHKFFPANSNSKPEIPVINAIFATSSNISVPSGAQDGDSVVNYECQLTKTDGQTVNDACKIEVFVTNSDSDKKIHKYSDLTSTNWKNPTYSELKSSNALFKVEIKESLYSQFPINNPKTLKLITKESTPKDIATIKQLFNATSKDTKTAYVVAKVNSFKNSQGSPVTPDAEPITIQNTTHKCLLFKEQTPSEGVNCSIHKMSTTSLDNLSALSFATDLNSKEVSINKTHYYLFKITDADNEKIPSEFAINGSTKLTLEGAVSGGTNANTINTLELVDVKPAYLFPNDVPGRLFMFDAN